MMATDESNPSEPAKMTQNIWLLAIRDLQCVCTGLILLLRSFLLSRFHQGKIRFFLLTVIVQIRNKCIPYGYVRSMVMWQNEIKLSCKFVTMNLHQIYIRLVVNVYSIRIRMYIVHHHFECFESRVCVNARLWTWKATEIDFANNVI